MVDQRNLQEFRKQLHVHHMLTNMLLLLTRMTPKLFTPEVTAVLKNLLTEAKLGSFLVKEFQTQSSLISLTVLQIQTW
jgi:hypothetical protein